MTARDIQGQGLTVSSFFTKIRSGELPARLLALLYGADLLLDPL